MLGNLQVHVQGIGDFAAQSEKVTKKSQQNVPLILPCSQAFQNWMVERPENEAIVRAGDCEGWRLPDGHS